MSPRELNPARNDRYRFFRQLTRDSALIVVVIVCMMASIASYLRAERAVDDAKESKAMAQTWQVLYKETERECRLAQLEIDDLRISLIKSGVTLEHGEKP